MTAFKQIPFFRICVPFVTGILVAKLARLSSVPYVLLVFLLAAALLCLLPSKPGKLIQRCFLICADIFLFCFAVNLVGAKQIKNNDNYFARLIKPDSANYIIAEVTDLPEFTGRYVKCNLKVLEVKTNKTYQSATGKLIGYFKQGYSSSLIKAGNILVIHSKLLEVEPPKNPFEFDYKGYLANRQIHHLCFIDSNAFYLTSLKPTEPALWQAGLKIKQYILSSLKNGGLTADAYSISAALLTGYSHGIDDTVMQAFAHSGTLHVLSVSGLHTGLIYILLAFLFDQVDRKKKYKVSKFIFITISLWIFALITGFSAPVLRAVIMFNLLGIGKIFFRNDSRNQLNILCVSAFLLLCYDPFLLFDIGFQLSYFAMFGILFFQPVFSKLWEPQSKISNYLWQSISASFAATIATLPFTLFYFKQFPLWFFICNLIVVPGSFLVLLLAALVVLKLTQFSVLINAIVGALISFIKLFNNPVTGFIDNIHFTLTDALLLGLLIILVSAAIYYRSYRYATFSFVLMVVLQINGIVSSFLAKKENLFSVYHLNKKQICGVKNATEVIIDTIDSRNHDYHLKPHLISFNYPSVTQSPFNYIRSAEEQIIHLTSMRKWPRCNFGNITQVVVSNNFKISRKDLDAFKNVHTIIADGTNNAYTIKILSTLCAERGITFYSTRQNGAYIVSL